MKALIDHFTPVLALTELQMLIHITYYEQESVFWPIWYQDQKMETHAGLPLVTPLQGISKVFRADS